MAKKKHHLCKWKSEEIEKKLKKYCKCVKNPHYVCCKCGRVANDRELLCKPMTFE